MNELPHLANIFDRLKRGYHLGPDDEPEFSALCGPGDYAGYFAALGLTLVHHDRDFFYFEPDNPETVPDTLPRIAVFSYIIIDHAANQGRPIEDFILGKIFWCRRCRISHSTVTSRCFGKWICMTGAT